jgi:hypothetical protein
LPDAIDAVDLRAAGRQELEDDAVAEVLNNANSLEY